MTFVFGALLAASAGAASGVTAAHADLGPASDSDVSGTVVAKSLPEIPASAWLVA